MLKQKPLRHRLRAAGLLLSLLLFPITLNYFSPYLIIMGASEGVINGSFLVFAGLFLVSLFFGRVWCGWVCPAGALGEVCQPINNKAVTGKKIDWIKWVIWIPWVTLIAVMAIGSGGYKTVNFLYGTENGISVAGSLDRPIAFAYIIYYGVISLFGILAVAVGRRAGCHAVCWMAPFMIIGLKIRHWLHLPALHLSAEPEKCTQCNTCTANCPMSLDVTRMVQLAKMENSECILCGTCVDGCSKNAIHFSFNTRS